MSEYTVAPPAWPRRARPGPRRALAPAWRERAHDAIVAAIAAGKALGLEGRKLELHVSRNGYPFDVRCNHPYRVWLHEYHRVLHGRRVPFDPRARRRLRERDAPGQAKLFR
jgi:hypothetical protein